MGKGFYRGATEPAPGNPQRALGDWAVYGAAFVVILATLALSPSQGRLDQKAKINYNELAKETIQAQFPFEVEDLDATAKVRDEAAAKVPDVYRVNPGRVDEQLAAFRQRVQALQARRGDLERVVRQALRDSTSAQSPDVLVNDAVTNYVRTLAQDPQFEGIENPASLALWVTPRLESLPKREFASAASPQDTAPQKTTTLTDPQGPLFEYRYFDRLLAASETALRHVLNYGVLPSPEQASADQPSPAAIVILRDAPVQGQALREEITSTAALPVLAAARRMLRTQLDEAIRQTLATGEAVAASTQELQDAAYQLAQLDISPTLAFYPEETERQRENARAKEKSVLRKYERYQPIQEMGRPWTQQSILAYETHQRLRQSGQGKVAGFAAQLTAYAVFTAMALICLARVVPLVSRRRSMPSRRRVHLSLLIICGMLILSRVISYFDPTGYAVPVAAGAILLAILLNVRVALVASMLMALLVSVQYQYNWGVLITLGAMAFAGALTISKVRRRSDMTGAALAAAATGLVVILAATLTGGAPSGDLLIQRLWLIALNALACLFLVPGLLSPLERLTGIVTDIQLLEYSDLNNELLSRLAIEVPATYAHSLMLGQLAEAAADAIGANGLLARVCAYYHDIGKLRRPEYFSENQTGVNVHDELSPRLSARAIASHVIEGAEMARDFHLPKPIVDGILEHHGTSMISFFHQQALAQQKHGDIDEADFRYPGPKPQTPETAILMICDAAESSVRSIKNPNEERIREVVDKLVSARLLDRQFDECELTLRDLDTIARVVTRRILTSQHTRIAYPDDVRKKQASIAAPPIGGDL